MYLISPHWKGHLSDIYYITVHRGFAHHGTSLTYANGVTGTKSGAKVFIIFNPAVYSTDELITYIPIYSPLCKYLLRLFIFFAVFRLLVCFFLVHKH